MLQKLNLKMSSKKIRLLHLVKSLDLGGVEKSTILYSNYLQKELDFIGIYASKGFYDQSNFISPKVKRFFPPNPVLKKKKFFYNLLNLLTILKNNKISHIHYHHRIFIPYIFFIKIFQSRIKIIYTHHNVFNDKRNMLLISDKIVALNEATKLDLPQRLQNKSTIISHGIQVVDESIPKSYSSKNIAYVGRFVQSKGLIHLLNTFKKVNKKHPYTHLSLIGDGEQKVKIINEINLLEIEKSVIIKEPLLTEDKLYTDIGIFVLPSTELEGFGLTLIEAMARQILVVVRDLPIFEGFIKNNYNGIVFTDDLYNKLISILEDPDQYKNVRLNGYKTVKENYLLEKTIEKYIHLYKEL